MKYYVGDSLSNFNFWGGGKERSDLLTTEQFDVVEKNLEDIEPEDGWSDTAINDMFWFEFDTICKWLGYKSQEHLELDIDDELLSDMETWAEDKSVDYEELFEIANMDKSDYEETDEDNNVEFDEDKATEDFCDWWNELDDFEKAEIYRKYN